MCPCHVAFGAADLGGRTAFGVPLTGAFRSGCQALGDEVSDASIAAVPESGCLGMQPKAGGKLHLRLNTDTSPIADKYREGKLKRTLKREFKST